MKVTRERVFLREQIHRREQGEEKELNVAK